MNKIKTRKVNEILQPYNVEEIAGTDGYINRAIKFPNGTMICYGNKNWGRKTMETIGRYSYTDGFIFPCEFAEQPICMVEVANNDSTNLFCAIIGIVRDKTQISQVSVYRDMASSSGDLWLHYIAIGRWKSGGG